MLIELHAHTSRHSRCSVIDPVTLVRHAVRKGLQGIVITEHHYLWDDEEIRKLRAEAGVEPSFLILAAQEVDTDIGHVLVFGAGRIIDARTPLQDLRREFPDAALVWAHPFRGGRRPSDEQLTNPLIDALEVFSLNQTERENYLALTYWHRLRFTAVCGSDTHSEAMAGAFPTIFDHDVASVTDIAAEIRNGRCRPFYKEIPKSGSGMRVTEITIGSKGADELRQRLIVRRLPDRNRWFNTKDAARIMETVHQRGFRRGSSFRVPRIIELNDDEQVLIEEGQRGKSLHGVLLSVDTGVGGSYLGLAAEWLAHFHDLTLSLPSPGGPADRERGRFEYYRSTFESVHHPATAEIDGFIRRVREREDSLLSTDASRFVQVHGDYHPKNIIIGRDLNHDPRTQFVSVIDFNNSFSFVPEFDVGYFLSQFANQFSDDPSYCDRYPDRVFLDAYRSSARDLSPSFADNVALFKLRANLSIAAHLIKVGKGIGPEMDALLERSRHLL